MGEVAVCIDVATDLGMEKESCVSTTELKPELDKKLSKEVTNEDVSSEVLNPLVSTKENASSCQDITSQTTDLAERIGVASLEVSSNCSGDSSPVETLSEEREISSGNNNNNTSQSNNSYREHSCGSDLVTKTHVVLEIPEHCRSSGIRKITFKFSKRKEDYDAQAFASAADSPMNGMLRGEECGGSYHDSWIDSGIEMPGAATNVYPCLPNMELKMSKKVVADNYPTNVKKLLSTGILDGARVKYIYSSSKRQLDGIIDGGGYLCGCSFCNFSKILSAYEFEQHAGVKTKHPNNHIFLENGKAIYSIIQELKAAPLSTLDEVLREVAGSSINEGFFQQWKASIRQSNEVIGADKKFYKKQSSFHASFVSCPSQVSEESLCPTLGPFVQNSPLGQRTYMDTSEEQKRPLKRLKPTISSSVVKQKKVADGSKKRDNDLHRLLFMPNGLPDGAELAYYVKGLKLLKGYKQGNGILCGHCNSEISPSQFEAHAGMAARRQPYRHIYTSNGLTLHDIAISLANGQKLNTSVSDGMCSKCGDGGVQVFCKSCSQAFHAACLDLQYVPEGDWHCSDCLKFGPGGNSTGIIVRSTRAVEKPEDEVSGCVICRKPNYEGKDGDKVTEGDAVIILCDQCEKEFHVGCLRDSRICLLEEIPKDEWFCCNDCNKIYWALHDLVSNGIQTIPVPQLNIITEKCAEKGYSIDGAANAIRWRVLLGKSREQEHRALLSRVAAIFRECFSPIVAANGHDLIPIMVYGRNISGQEFGAMHCVLLTVNNVVVSAGLLRVFGKEVAELPLVATSRGHQGKGYFQALFSCIESLLCSLNVKNLVLPAAEEAESIWTRKFGFKKMNKEQLSKYTREYQLTVFRDTSVLEKEVPRAQ